MSLLLLLICKYLFSYILDSSCHFIDHSYVMVLLTASKSADVAATAPSVTGAASAAGINAIQSSFCFRGISVPLLVSIPAPSGSLKTV